MKHLSNTDQNSNKLTNVPTPVNAGDAVNKSYTDTGLDSKVNGDGLQTITVSDTAPTSPQDGDLWIDESEEDSGETFDMGNLTVSATGVYMVPLGFTPSFIEFEVVYHSGSGSATPVASTTGYYKVDGDVSYSQYIALRNGDSKFDSNITSCPFGTRLMSSNDNVIIGIDGTVSLNPSGFQLNVTTKNGVFEYYIIWKARR